MPHEALDYGVRTDQSYLNRTDSCSILRHRQDEVSRIVHVEELGSSFTKLILCELGPISVCSINDSHLILFPNSAMEVCTLHPLIYCFPSDILWDAFVENGDKKCCKEV